MHACRVDEEAGEGGVRTKIQIVAPVSFAIERACVALGLEDSAARIEEARKRHEAQVHTSAAYMLNARTH